jgi:hypothetical protein
MQRRLGEHPRFPWVAQVSSSWERLFRGLNTRFSLGTIPMHEWRHSSGQWKRDQDRGWTRHIVSVQVASRPTAFAANPLDRVPFRWQPRPPR